MAVDIRTMQSAEAPAWDAYVQLHPHATLYHLSSWRSIIQDTYNHKPYYLMAVKKEPKSNRLIDAITGVLPLVHLKSFLFGNQLISIPFFDMGGVIADDADTEKALINEAMRLGKRLTIDCLELRQPRPASFPGPYSTKTHKVRMLLDLPESAEALMKGFKSKLRSQIKKALKEGLKTEIGGLELLDDFYEVFLVNMRDLGSPVHPKELMESVLTANPNTSRIVVVYQKRKPLACSVVIGFADTLENPWASSLRKYSKLAPNMLLYWAMLEYACDKGFRYFDFGRSTPEEGTFKFKKQWGAKPVPLYWHYVYTGEKQNDNPISENEAYAKASQIWSKLPISITRIIGPHIRKYISL